MAEQDTVKLLRECDAGIKMGVASIGDVLPYVKQEAFKQALLTCKHAHEELGLEADKLLSEYHDEGKEPNPIAKGMSWVKTNMKLGMHESDKTVADLITDGCDMGVKSLSRYLNQYPAAEERAKDLANRLIRLEEQLGVDIRAYL
ncbi:MAG: hypothetical protein J6T24_07970 [Clostridia bacterium]|nr:hypothetical protein [Clostridia bacterium]